MELRYMRLIAAGILEIVTQEQLEKLTNEFRHCGYKLWSPAFRHPITNLIKGGYFSVYKLPTMRPYYAERPRYYGPLKNCCIAIINAVDNNYELPPPPQEKPNVIDF